MRKTVDNSKMHFLQVVKLLLEHRPPTTLDRFVRVTPVKGAGGSDTTKGRRSPAYVDLMAMAGAQEKFTPLQDAVEGGKINIVRLILGRYF